MSNLHYLVHYCLEEHKEERSCSIAGATKAEYIMQTIESCGRKLNVISASENISEKNLYGNQIEISDNIKLQYLPSLKRGNKLKNLISHLLFRFRLLRIILSDVKSNDIMIVYHSVSFIRLLSLIKKVKKFKLILEVEEIYGDVKQNNKISKREVAFAEKYADAFIFSTQLLEERISVTNRPVALSHGAYRVKENHNIVKKDEIIHIVYAGTSNPQKGGLNAAIDAAQYLDSRYHLHILTFGSDEILEKMKERIKYIEKNTSAKITFDGALYGNEYECFLQKCDIGLSTQNLNASCNDSSFPSKILVYMSNGLRVVSVKIPAIETSLVSDYMYFYDEQNPEAIAEAIKNIKFDDMYNGREIIRGLDENFRDSISTLINNI